MIRKTIPHAWTKWSVAGDECARLFHWGGELDQLFQPSDIHEGKADYSRIHGNHTFKMGGNIDSDNMKIQNRFPTLSFNTTQTSNPQSSVNTGSALASFLLNLPDTAERRNTVQSVR